MRTATIPTKATYMAAVRAAAAAACPIATRAPHGITASLLRLRVTTTAYPTTCKATCKAATTAVRSQFSHSSLPRSYHKSLRHSYQSHSIFHSQQNHSSLQYHNKLLLYTTATNSIAACPTRAVHSTTSISLITGHYRASDRSESRPLVHVHKVHSANLRCHCYIHTTKLED